MNQQKVSLTKVLEDCHAKLDKKSKETKCENIRVAALCIKQAIDLINKQKELEAQLAKAARERAKI